MSKVPFTYKTGRTRMLRASDARLLQKLGQGTYQTRVVQADIPEPEITAPSSSDDLDNLDVAELHALAKERGVKVHHASGADKVREALREAEK